MSITILADVAVSLDGFPVAILDHSEPAFYCILAKAYEALMNKLEDVELAVLIESRKLQAEIDADWDEL